MGRGNLIKLSNVINTLVMDCCNVAPENHKTVPMIFRKRTFYFPWNTLNRTKPEACLQKRNIPTAADCSFPHALIYYIMLAYL